MHDSCTIITWRSFWALRVGIGVESCKNRVPREALPIQLFRHFCYVV